MGAATASPAARSRRPHEDRAAARARLGIEPGETCVLVFGGSLGARSINLAAIEAYAGAAFRVLHVCGRRDYPELAARPRPPGYDLREYLDLDEFAQALAAADLVVARAGGSLFEVAAHGRPAILVPYPHASADHQAANARWMERGGAAVVVPDGELSRRAPRARDCRAAGRSAANARDGGGRPAARAARRGGGGCWGAAGGGAGMSGLAMGGVRLEGRRRVCVMWAGGRMSEHAEVCVR